MFDSGPGDRLTAPDDSLARSCVLATARPGQRGWGKAPEPTAQSHTPLLLRETCEPPSDLYDYELFISALAPSCC